jgi:hypothetical protein
MGERRAQEWQRGLRELAELHADDGQQELGQLRGVTGQLLGDQESTPAAGPVGAR